MTNLEYLQQPVLNFGTSGQAIHAEIDRGEVATQLLVMLPLAYMCIASNYSLFRLGMFKLYHLVPHWTDVGSLLLNASLACRFAPPLCYNFLHVIHMHEYLMNGEVRREAVSRKLYLGSCTCACARLGILS